MTLRACFIAMFEEPIRSWADTSLIARARKLGIIDVHVESILQSVLGNHHKVDDTPYGGGPGELMRIDVIEPLIAKALEHSSRDRNKKRVILMDPAGVVFSQDHAERLAAYEELIFVCGRYEGIDARIHHFVDEAMSIGDFVLSNGDLAAMTIFDATARMIDGVLGNSASIEHESHAHHRLEGSHYTRPVSYKGYEVPLVYKNGNHKAIDDARRKESLIRTIKQRPDLLQNSPLSEEEKKIINNDSDNESYPWQKIHE